MEILKEQVDTLKKYLSEKERIKKGFKTRTEILQEQADRIVKDELRKRNIESD